MALSCKYETIITLPLNFPKCCKNHNLAINPSRFLCSESMLKLKHQTLHSKIQIKNRNTRTTHIVFAAQSNIWALQTAWKVGKDGIEAGTRLVPGSIPRPIARIGVTVAASVVALFLLKSFISTAFFVLAMMGVIYFTYIAFNKDEGPRNDDENLGRNVDEGTTSLDESLEEAKRIMEKYK
ncbi:hypothetical protein Leryth_024200 [Lithospermum erythrorhizon]|nr:hypothetical protein Leryth_024200 [Lithospermum erythrorhizon]